MPHTNDQLIINVVIKKLKQTQISDLHHPAKKKYILESMYFNSMIQISKYITENIIY